VPLILDSIEEAAKQGTRFVIVDNLTFLCPDAEKSALAAGSPKVFFKYFYENTATG